MPTVWDGGDLCWASPLGLEVIISGNSARLGSNGISGSENPFLLRLTRTRAASRSGGPLSRDPAGRNAQIKENKKDVAMNCVC